jgi:hypothetical protein
MDTFTLARKSGRPAKLPTIRGVSSTGPDGHEPSKNVVCFVRPHMEGGTIKWDLKIQHKFNIKVNGWARGDLLQYGGNTIIGLTRGDEQDEFGTIYMLTGDQ